jgi:hypothetical protein
MRDSGMSPLAKMRLMLDSAMPSSARQLGIGHAGTAQLGFQCIHQVLAGRHALALKRY